VESRGVGDEQGAGSRSRKKQTTSEELREDDTVNVEVRNNGRGKICLPVDTTRIVVVFVIAMPDLYA